MMSTNIIKEQRTVIYKLEKHVIMLWHKDKSSCLMLTVKSVLVIANMFQSWILFPGKQISWILFENIDFESSTDSKQ